MIAINIDRALVARVMREGWAAVPADQRGGLSNPAPAVDDYLNYLAGVIVAKQRLAVTDRSRKEGTRPIEPDLASVMESDEFKRFVAAQLTWDRAMAEALAEARRKRPGSLVVGVLGRGHAQFGHGVPHQLADLGVADTAVVLPVDSDAAARDCRRISPTRSSWSRHRNALNRRRQNPDSVSGSREPTMVFGFFRSWKEALPRPAALRRATSWCRRRVDRSRRYRR